MGKVLSGQKSLCFINVVINMEAMGRTRPQEVFAGQLGIPEDSMSLLELAWLLPRSYFPSVVSLATSCWLHWCVGKTWFHTCQM